VHGSASVEFVPGDVPQPRPRPRRAGAAALIWPTYGFDDRRLRAAPPGIRLRPPFRRIWMFRGRVLLEFPPAVAHGRLYLPTFDGRFYALDAATGKPIWRYGSGRCAWASPALVHGVLYQTFLNRSRNCDAGTNSLGGELDAFDGARRSARPSPRRSSRTGSSSSATGPAPCARSTPAPAAGAGRSRRAGR
jgi:PQQ enzyme repeat